MEIPQGITFRVDGFKVTAKGPQGEVHKTFPKGSKVSLNGSKIEVQAPNKAMLGTLESILNSMAKGVSSGYSKNFKLLYAHFPITIEVKGSDILVKNFLGEKMPRKTVLVGTTKVLAKGQNVTVSGPDKEAVGQTIANLRIAMKIKDKDGRVFQDGIYEVEG